MDVGGVPAAGATIRRVAAAAAAAVALTGVGASAIADTGFTAPSESAGSG